MLIHETNGEAREKRTVEAATRGDGGDLVFRSPCITGMAPDHVSGSNFLVRLGEAGLVLLVMNTGFPLGDGVIIAFLPLNRAHSTLLLVTGVHP